jgi:dTDP-4-dehydrorhamnose reductase
MRVLILGVTGMFGNALHEIFASDPQHEVWGTLRSPAAKKFFPAADHARLIDGVDVTDRDALAAVLNRVRPDVVINAVGVIKQLAAAEDPAIVMPINAELPHRLAALCGTIGARMIQISTDCVFSGRAGNYLESDVSDAEDLYGKSKYMGEVHDQPHVITLRTSGIGHELNSRNGLLEWFLAQQGQVKGFSKAIYSGLPWVELSRVIKDVVLPRPEMSGLYHVSSKPISKLDLLRLVATVYGKDIKIVPDDALRIDRSLNSARFTAATGYVAAEWPELIAEMHEYRPGAAGLSNVR